MLQYSGQQEQETILFLSTCIISSLSGQEEAGIALSERRTSLNSIHGLGLIECGNSFLIKEGDNHPNTKHEFHQDTDNHPDGNSAAFSSRIHIDKEPMIGLDISYNVS